MEIFKASLEIIEAIAEIIQWIVGKVTGRPKTASKRSQDDEADTPSSLLSIVLKPIEPFLLLFTKHSVILLALLVVYGLIFKLNLDKSFGVFFVGVIFALAGAGNLVETGKNVEEFNCVHYLLYAFSAAILLFGILVSVGALILIMIGIPINP
jgi:hypothetical protein